MNDRVPISEPFTDQEVIALYRYYVNLWRMRTARNLLPEWYDRERTEVLVLIEERRERSG